MSRSIRGAVIAAAAILMLAACGKPAKEVIADNTPAVQTLRSKLNTIVGGLPSLGSAVSMSLGPMDPKPIYDRKSGTFNTAFVSVEQLRDDSAPAFDLVLESDLSHALAWTGSRNPMAASRLEEGDDGLSDTFAAALKTPYVVIYRTVSYERPVASADGTSFDGGTLDLEAFVVPVERNAWIASCRIAAESDTKVQFSMKKGDDPKERSEAFANSTLRDDALAKLAACLTEQTSGTFQLSAN